MAILKGQLMNADSLNAAFVSLSSPSNEMLGNLSSPTGAFLANRVQANSDLIANNLLTVKGRALFTNSAGIAEILGESISSGTRLKLNADEMLLNAYKINLQSGGDLIVNPSSGGNVGIGIATPGYKLSVGGTGAFTRQLSLMGGSNGGNDTMGGTDISAAFLKVGATLGIDPNEINFFNTQAYIGTYGNYGIEFRTNGTNNRFTIAGDGKVAVGPHMPSFPFHFKGSAWSVSDGGLFVIESSSNSTSLTLRPNNNDVADPDHKKGWSMVTPMDSWSQARGSLTFIYNGVSYGDTMTLTREKKVGIGNVNPAHNIDVTGTGRVTGRIYGDSGITFYNGQDKGIQFGSGTKIHTVDEGNLVFTGNNSIRFGDTTDWSWNKWAGIKYKDSAKTIYIGGPAGSEFQANASPPNINIDLRQGVTSVNTPHINTAGNINVSGGSDGLVVMPPNVDSGGWARGYWMRKHDNSKTFGFIGSLGNGQEATYLSFGVGRSGADTWLYNALKIYNTGGPTSLKFNDGISDRYVWHAGNQGSGSGLDADLLDGIDSAGYATVSTVATGTDLNSVIRSGIYRLSSNHGNTPSTDWGQMLVMRGSGDTVAQVALDYSSNNFKFRSGNPSEVGGKGSWGAWRRMWHNGDSTITATTFDGNATSSSKWATGRTITLGEDATGSVTIDGTTNVTLNVSVKDDSHLHDNQYLKRNGDMSTGFLNIRKIGKDSNGVYIPYPDGGEFVTTVTEYTGAIKITLPATWTSTMMQFVVDIYNYATGTKATYFIGGYNYSSSNPAWINASAYCIGSNAGNSKAGLPVRFAHDGSKCCVLIGETNTVWNYPQVIVRNFFGGYAGGIGMGIWDSGWNISITNTLPSAITATITDTLTASSYSSDSDKVDGLHSSSFFRRDTTNDADVRFTSGDGRGVRFWDSDQYKIYMSASGNSTWGGRVAGETTSDYNMYFKMTGGVNRGWVFKSNTSNVAGIDASGNGYFAGLKIGSDRVLSVSDISASVSSTSTSTVASSSAVKTAYDKANEALSAAQNPTGHTHYTVGITDNRDTSPTPDQAAARNISTFFNNTYGDGWRSGITVKGWNSGYCVWQLGSASSTNQLETLSFRSGINSTWGPWRRVYHEGFKPTPDDIGALSKGYSINMKLTNLRDWKPSEGGSLGYYAGGWFGELGNSRGYMSIGGTDGDMSIIVDGDYYKWDENASTYHRVMHTGDQNYTLNRLDWEGEVNYSITLKEHNNDTWFRNSGSGTWTFQSGTNGDDWTKTVSFTVPDTSSTDSSRWFELGQRRANANSGAFRGLWVVQYLNGNKTDGDIYVREMHARDIRMRKTNGGWSTIYFEAPSGGNDPGYIGHYESSNTSILRFVVSDDDAETDYFEFGCTPGGNYSNSMTVKTNGSVWTKAYGWLHEKFALKWSNDLVINGKRAMVGWAAADQPLIINYAGDFGGGTIINGITELNPYSATGCKLIVSRDWSGTTGTEACLKNSVGGGWGFIGNQSWGFYRVYGNGGTVSDRKKKYDITKADVELLYDYVKDINVYNYRTISENIDDETGEVKEQIYREDLMLGCMINELPTECVFYDNEGGDGKAIDDYSYSTMILGSVKHMQNKTEKFEEETTEKIETISDEMNSLKNRIEELEELLNGIINGR